MEPLRERHPDAIMDIATLPSARAVILHTPAPAPELPEDRNEWENVALRALVDRSRTFRSLTAALQHVVETLIPRRHRYMANITGPDRAIVAQFVPAASAGRLGFGLTMHLAFEEGSPEMARFQASRASAGFQFVPWGGIPCFVAYFGTDVDAAVRAFLDVALATFYNRDALDITCMVWDDGPRRVRK